MINFDSLSYQGKIDLKDASNIDLNERYDLKLLMPVTVFNTFILSKLQDFLVQTVNNGHVQTYHTRYWDSPDKVFLRAHLAGKNGRVKVRKRFYPSTKVCFLEIKQKRSLKTIKTRIRSEYSNSFSKEDISFLSENNINSLELSPSLEVNYNRIIYWEPTLAGRITVDFDFEPFTYSKKLHFENVAIIEVKGDRQFINKIMKKFDFPVWRYKSSFSKYSVGVLMAGDMSDIPAKGLLPVYKKLLKLNNSIC